MLLKFIYKKGTCRFATSPFLGAPVHANPFTDSLHIPDGLATCEPLQIMGMSEPLLCGTADGPGRFDDADAVEDDGQGGCVMDDSGPEGADFP